MDTEVFTAAHQYIQKFKPIDSSRVHAIEQTTQYCIARFPYYSRSDIQRGVVAAWRRYVDNKGPIQARERQQLSSILEQLNLADYLTQREQTILKLRYGLLNHRVHSLADVGRTLQITRERVRQIEANALRKLKKLVS